MNLENLISQYIDGDLSHEEDLLLRDLIRNDNLTREKFNSSVELHLELKEDSDSIKVPEDFLRATEDKILMNIMNANAAIITKLEPKRVLFSYKRMSYVAAAIFLFAITSIFEFGKFDVGNIANPTQSKSEFTKSVANSEAKSNRNHKSKKNNLMVSSIASIGVNSESMLTDYIELGSINSSLDISSENAKPQAMRNSFNESQNIMAKNSVPSPDFVNSEIDQVQNSIKLGSVETKNIQLNKLSQNVGNMNNSLIFDPFLLDKNEIRLESNFSQDITRGGINTTDNKSIKNISQSISYNIDNSKRIGIECGLTKFEYQILSKVIVGSGIGNLNGSSTEDFGGGDNLNGISVPVRINQNHQMFWGSIFYEQTLYATDFLNVDSRIGFGSSNQGAIGFGRITSKMLIYGPIYLTLGTEGRLFMIENKSITNSDVSSTFSLIYGMQFKF